MYTCFQFSFRQTSTVITAIRIKSLNYFMALLCLGAPDSLPSGSWARTATFSSLSEGCIALPCPVLLLCPSLPCPHPYLHFAVVGCRSQCPWGNHVIGLIAGSPAPWSQALQRPVMRGTAGSPYRGCPRGQGQGWYGRNPLFLTSTLSGTSRPYSLSSGGAGQSPVLLPQ